MGDPVLNVPGGSIAFIGGSPSVQGDYRLFQNVGNSPILSNFSLPAAPLGEAYTWTTADTGYIDLACVGATASWAAANGSGSWTQGSNWSGMTGPDGGTATFGDTALAPITVTLDGPQTAAALVFNTTNGNGYTLAPGNVNAQITLGTPAGGSIVVASGSHLIYRADHPGRKPGRQRGSRKLHRALPTLSATAGWD